MKKLAKLTLIVLIASSCASSVQNTKIIAEYDVQEIVQLINNKDSLALKNALNKQNVNSFDSTGVNLLTHGIMTGDLNIVKMIGENGANPNLKNKTQMGSTPLMMASEYESLEIANYLIEKGADLNIQDANGDPVINWSAYFGNIPFTRLMLENGAKTDLKSIHSNGVMQVALKEWQYGIVDLLHEYNVNENIVEESSKDVNIALKKNNLEMFKSLVNKDNVNTRDGASNTLLMNAAKNGYSDILNYLLKEGAEINEINSVGHTALNLSVYFGQDSTARYLIEKGADVNKTDDRFKLSPLIAAIRSNHLELGEILLKKGANINATDGTNNFTPIMWATLYQNKDFVKLLLKYDPDLSIKSKYNQTVFEMTEDEEMLKLLEGK